MSPTPVRQLFETHLTVRDLQRSVAFYRDVVGLELGRLDEDRRVAFLWIGGRGKTMLGLWAVGSAPLGMRLHTAFTVDLERVLAAPLALRKADVVPLDFYHQPTDEPSVLAWMPAASVYFNDPDSHLLEYIAMLPQDPQPDGGVVKYSAWIGSL
jgi:lactoylglutathione lyase